MAAFGTILIIALVATIAALYLLNRRLAQATTKHRQMLQSYSAFEPSKGTQSAVDVAAEYVRSQGAKVYNTFILSQEKNMLIPQNEVVSITLSEKSSPVKAFYTLTAKQLDPKYDTDKKLIERYGKKAWLIPVAQTPGRPCWKEHGCQNDHCPCHSTGQRRCWLQSDKNHHKGDMKTYREKERKCLRCASFLPCALMIGQGGDMQHITDETNKAFGPLLKTVKHVESQALRTSTDPLTGAHSQDALMQRLETLYPICLQHKIPLSAFAFEVDNPQGIIDHYGVYALQSIVRQTVSLAMATTTTADICARMAPEETIYITILPNTEKTQAIQAAEKLRETVTETKYNHTDKSGVDRTVLVRISAGVSEILTDDSESPTALLRDAYTALYNAKTHKNKVLPYNQQLPKPKEKKGRQTPDAESKKKSQTLKDILND